MMTQDTITYLVVGAVVLWAVTGALLNLRNPKPKKKKCNGCTGCNTETDNDKNAKNCNK